MKDFGLKSKLKNNELSLGSWITIGHPSVVEIMASAGFDWLTIDMEHAAIDFETAQQLIHTIQSFSMSALVRVSQNEEVVIKRVMDSGANGVIVPMIKSKQEAERAVDYVKYPPAGKRGVGLARAQQYGMGFHEYKDWLEQHAVIIAQVEHIQAVENIDAILSTPGIDGIIIGPYDLSASMGMPGEFENKEVKEALEEVKAACFRNSFPMGFHVIQPDYGLFQEKFKEGYRFIAFSIDFLFLGNKVREQMKGIRKRGNGKIDQ